MRKLLSIAALMLALVALSFAHGGAEHVMGKVKAITTDSITVVTKTSEEKTVTFDGSTMFMKSGQMATAKDLKVGYRVVIDVHDMSGKLHAAEVRFGKKSTATPTQQTHKHSN